MRVVYIGERISHHAARSGYDQLANHIRSRRLSVPLQKALAGVIKRLPQSVTRSWLDTPPHAWFWKPRQLANEILAMASIPVLGGVYHWLYGENDFRRAGSTPRHKNSRIVVSLHQPPEIFARVVRDKINLQKVDAVIACSSSQKDYLDNLTEASRVHVVPHGVDTDFFIPGPDKPERKKDFTVLTVGGWLRDFAQLAKVIDEARQKNPGIRFNLVLPPGEAEKFQGMPNAGVFSDISDLDLLAQYRQADALFLPVTDFTASNALLEGMACGLPVVATDVGGMRDYLDPSCGIFIPPQDADQALDALISLKDDPALSSAMASAARQKALDFDWKKVAKKMKEVYNGLYA